MRHGVVAAQQFAQALRSAADQVVAGRVAERLVDAAEIVEVDAQQRDRRTVAAGVFHHLPQARQEPAAAAEPGEAVDILARVEPLLRARALGAERVRQLPHFVRVERLLQVEQLVGRRHALRDHRGIDVGVGRADHDLGLWVQLADALGRPGAIRAGRHAHVEKHDGVRPTDGARRAYRRDRSLGPVAVFGLERRCAARPGGRQRCRAARQEQSLAQVVDLGARRAGHRVAEDLPVGVEHRRFVVDDEDAHG